ncbi:MAG TPA: DegT/DnrJ/EryC1/StrS family aminotransferase [Planctomycetota bacterium]|nr:DegT/DnrJ/EryC1/StrS family aminotransferase [Planctomycetota bacterium]
MKLALKGGTPVRARPFAKWPEWDEREGAALRGVLESGSWGGYPSPNRHAREFAAKFAAYCGTTFGVCAANGSVTLEMALLAAGLEPGSEVIVPAYTFVATASAVVYTHGVPVFVDVDPDTYCMDPRAVEAAITPRTRAIIPVHLACNMADMDAILAIAEKRGLLVIEDCAHAHGATWRGKKAGSLGAMGSFSFQSSKLLTAGEGGIVVTSDRQLEMRLQSLVNCGRKEPGYDAFEGRMLGKNYRITEWSAAVLSAQLDRLDEQLERRIPRARRLEERLRGLPGISFLKQDPRQDRRAIYQFIVRYDATGFGGAPRDRVVQALNAEGIPADGDFYTPLYQDHELFPMDRKTNPLAFLEYAKGYDLRRFHCPVTEKAAFREAIWLPHPIFLGSDEDVDDVAKAFEKIHESAAELA